jgi:hypothetical protein
MHRKSPFKLFAAVALLCALVCAEALSVVHSLDFDAHANGEPCKICISVAGVGAGAPHRAVLPEAPRAGEPGSWAPAAFVDSRRAERRSARGPPVVS